MSRAELLLLNFCCPSVPARADVAHFIVLDSSMQVLTDATDFHRLYSVYIYEIRETKIRRWRNISHLLRDYFSGNLNCTR
jgi:hypothetical protein